MSFSTLQSKQVGHNLGLAYLSDASGSQSLSLNGDSISLSGGGGSVAVGSASSVVSNTQKLTAQSYNSSLLVTELNSDVVVGTALAPKQLNVFGNENISGYVQPSRILDNATSSGTNGQILSSSGTALSWINSPALRNIANIAGDFTDLGITGVYTVGTNFNSNSTTPPKVFTPTVSGTYLVAYAMDNAGITYGANLNNHINLQLIGGSVNPRPLYAFQSNQVNLLNSIDILPLVAGVTYSALIQVRPVFSESIDCTSAGSARFFCNFYLVS